MESLNSIEIDVCVGYVPSPQEQQPVAAKLLILGAATIADL